MFQASFFFFFVQQLLRKTSLFSNRILMKQESVHQTVVTCGSDTTVLSDDERKETRLVNIKRLVR